jgi:hypothetical protein
VSKVRSRLTYANVTATIALFLVLGGGAIAALKVPKKSVGTKQLKAKAVKTPKLADGAVTDSKLANGAVTDAKVAAATLTAGKIAPGQVFKGVVAREAVSANQGAGAFFAQNLQCAPGEVAIGGGSGGTTAGTRTFPGADTFTDTQASAPIDAAGQAIADGQVPTGWHVSATINGGGPNKDIRLWVLCAQR